MSESIIIALISGGLTLFGVIISNSRRGAEQDAKIEMAQAVQNAKLEELTREVRKHNNFAQRMPVVEEQIKVINHRIDDLEKELSK